MTAITGLKDYVKLRLDCIKLLHFDSATVHNSPALHHESRTKEKWPVGELGGGCRLFIQPEAKYSYQCF